VLRSFFLTWEIGLGLCTVPCVFYARDNTCKCCWLVDNFVVSPGHFCSVLCLCLCTECSHISYWYIFSYNLGAVFIGVLSHVAIIQLIVFESYF
jgi:hypothetical protein